MSEAQLHISTEILMKHLENVASNALEFVQAEEFIETYKNLFSAFQPFDKSVRPPLAGSSSEALKIRDNLRKYVMSSIKEEIKLTVEADSLDNLLRKLHEMKCNNQISENLVTAWRPPGNAEEHIKHFNTSVKLELRKKLKCQVTVEREKLNILKSKVEMLRNKVCSYDKSITQRTMDLQNDISLPTENSS